MSDLSHETPEGRAGVRRGLAGFIARRPRRVFWSTLLVALLVGVGIGVSGGVPQEDLDAANAKAAGASEQVSALTGERDTLTAELATLRAENGELTDRVRTLSAKGEVPDFTGEAVEDVDDVGAVADYDWNVKTRTTISERSPGTVIAQSPREGTTLKAGRSITLTVAKKAPPKPKQWVTTRTLQGGSSTKTPEFTIPDGAKARLIYSMPQDSNNAIILYQAPDEYIDLLLNEIGPQSGSTRLYQSGTYYLDVTGAYTIQVQVFKRPS